MNPYCPSRGDVVWVDFDPQVGHEQKGHRPALILSPQAYNQRTGLAILCPISKQQKGYAFEVAVPEGYKVSGAILSDHVKNFDWRARRIRLLCHLPSRVVLETLAKLETLLSA